MYTIIGYGLPILLYFICLAVYAHFFGNKISKTLIQVFSFLTVGLIYGVILWYWVFRDYTSTNDLYFQTFKPRKIISYKGKYSFYDEDTNMKILIYDFKLVNDYEDIKDFELQSLLEYQNVNKIETKRGQDYIILEKKFDEYETFKKGDTLSGLYCIKLDSIDGSVMKEKSVLYWLARDIYFEPKINISIRGKREGGASVGNEIDHNIDFSYMKELIKDAWNGKNNVILETKDEKLNVLDESLLKEIADKYKN